VVSQEKTHPQGGKQVTLWAKHPIIYEINTWVWLEELGQKYEKPVTLGTVPRDEWDALRDLGIDAVWFMGVWERSPAGIAIANRNADLLKSFQQALSDYRPEDNVGSPYCVRRYVADKHLGGPQGLAVARGELASRDIRLLLDFVPNHVAPDHPWAMDNPEYFVQGSTEDMLNDPASFIGIGEKIFACGRDPYFPAWPDVIQLNAFHPGLRRTVIETLSDIAGQCDGVRCDMAMLLINSIFERTWVSRAGQPPETEYWVEVISSIRRAFPNFLFIAEAYWDLEWELQQQGFDYCYDKRLYDRLEHEDARSVRLHLHADLAYQEKLVRFIENHDEPRATAVFSPERHRASAVTIATVPGAKLFHEGQFEGRKVKLPVFLGRRPCEPADTALSTFYRTFLKTFSLKEMRNGLWQICDCTGWPDNRSCENLIAWSWQSAGGYRLIVVNLSALSAQGRIPMPWPELKGRIWQITDIFTESHYDWSGDEMCNTGLYVDLPPWGYHVLAQWRPIQ
jgi:hypothetical protein